MVCWEYNESHVLKKRHRAGSGSMMSRIVFFGLVAFLDPAAIFCLWANYPQKYIELLWLHVIWSKKHFCCGLHWVTVGCKIICLLGLRIAKKGLQAGWMRVSGLPSDQPQLSPGEILIILFLENVVHPNKWTSVSKSNSKINLIH